MKVPVSWLREYVDFDLPVDELARRLVFTSCEVDRVVHRGVRGRRTATSGASSSARCSRRTSIRTPTGCSSRRWTSGEAEPRSIVCGAWNFGAGATVAVALPGATLPNGADARAPQGARRGVRRDDPRGGRGRPRHRSRRDHAARRRARAGHAARGRAAARRHGARDRDGLQPPRPHVRLRHRPRGLGAARRAPGAHARGTVPRTCPERRAGGHPDRRLRALPALHRAPVPRRRRSPTRRAG